MSRVALPVPHAVIDNIGDVHFDADNWRGISLFTTTQAEAYAAAKVREALEKAESIVRSNADACSSLAVKVLLSANADAIGELIPPLPGPVEP